MTIRRILFLGNSITLHEPNPDLGWTGSWGMAASRPELDYVNLLLARLSDGPGACAPMAMVANIADFERQCGSYRIHSELKAQLDFAADVVVVAIGENVPALTSPEAEAAFRAGIAELLGALTEHGHPLVIVRSCFWPDDAKDGILRETCVAMGGTFVDIGRLGSDEANYARSERCIEHAGVAAHPGDRGMQAIADAIWAALQSVG